MWAISSDLRDLSNLCDLDMGDWVFKYDINFSHFQQDTKNKRRNFVKYRYKITFFWVILISMYFELPDEESDGICLCVIHPAIASAF